MSQQNVDAFKRAVDAYNRGDVEAFVGEFDPAAEWHTLTQAVFDGVPRPGPRPIERGGGRHADRVGGRLRRRKGGSDAGLPRSRRGPRGRVGDRIVARELGAIVRDGLASSRRWGTRSRSPSRSGSSRVSELAASRGLQTSRGPCPLRSSTCMGIPSARGSGGRSSSARAESPRTSRASAAARSRPTSTIRSVATPTTLRASSTTRASTASRSSSTTSVRSSAWSSPSACRSGSTDWSSPTTRRCCPDTAGTGSRASGGRRWWASCSWRR